MIESSTNLRWFIVSQCNKRAENLVRILFRNHLKVHRNDFANSFNSLQTNVYTWIFECIEESVAVSIEIVHDHNWIISRRWKDIELNTICTQPNIRICCLNKDFHNHFSTNNTTHRQVTPNNRCWNIKKHSRHSLITIQSSMTQNLKIQK